MVTDTRDVGAHLNTQEHQKRGTTLTERLTQTTGDVKRLNYIRAPYDKKEKVIRGKLLPKGFFGCETAPINESAMQKNRTAIVNTLTYATTKRATDLKFAVASGKTDVDPDVEVYTRRATMYRRMVGANDDNKKWLKKFMKHISRSLNPERTKEIII